MNVVIDGREMQPPEPLERTLEALDRIGSEDRIVLWLHCHPQPLFNILRRNGYSWTEADGPDGSYEYTIVKAS